MSVRARFDVMILAGALVVAAVACGGDDGDEVTTETTTSASTSTAGGAPTNEEIAACLEGEGLELAEPGSDDLPLVGGTPADPQPPLMNGVESIDVLSASGGANVFVYDSTDDADAAFATLQDMGLPMQVVENAVIVMSAPSLPEVESAVAACLE